jgi:(p)ppGpp synthase/HD superfamily hydrolase
MVETPSREGAKAGVIAEEGRQAEANALHILIGARMSGRSLSQLSLDELARLGEKAEVGSDDHGRIMAELARRQTIAQIEATQAQKTASEAEEKAAKAIVDTALHTERSANYLFWSVIAATLSTMITAAGVLFHLFGRG